MTRMLAVLLAALVAASPAAADDRLVLEGAFTQGGLVRGRVPSGARVALDDKPVRVDRDGNFLLGFAREAPAENKVSVIFRDGTRHERALAISPRTFDIQRIDGLPPRQVTPSPDDLERIARERKAIVAAWSRDSDRPRWLGGFAWPAEGRISGVYGSQRILNGEPRRPHFGVDVAAPVGTPILAAADGVVSLAAHDMFFTGHTVILDHGLGLSTLYAHLDAIVVREGDEVARGAPIGRLGGTGRVTGPHLHWGMNLGSLPLDPALVVPPMPARASGGATRATGPAGTGSTIPSSR